MRIGITAEVVEGRIGLANVKAKIERDFQREIDRAGDQVMRRAKERCPVRTGRLRDSIHVERSGSGFDRAVAVGTDVEYGPYVEFGTSRQAAHPFLGPSWDEERPRLIRALGQVGR